MSDVTLPRRYAADNFTKALDNLTKRFQKDEKPIHFRDNAFDGLSEDQSSAGLSFFAEVGVIEKVARGEYKPPEQVITWRQGLEGEARQEAIHSILSSLEDEYEIFEELLFLLDANSEKSVSELATDIGGKVGIDQDELQDMEKAIEIFHECGFVEIGPDKQVTKTELVENYQNPPSGSSNQENTGSEEDNNPITSQKPSGTESTAYEEKPPQGSHHEEPSDGVTQQNQSPIQSRPINIEISIDMDVTKMDPEDLEKKLEIIDKIGSDD